MATADAPDLSDLSDEQVEMIATQCEISAAGAARGGKYDTADLLNQAAKIVRAWAEDQAI